MRAQAADVEGPSRLPPSIPPAPGAASQPPGWSRSRVAIAVALAASLAIAGYLYVVSHETPSSHVTVLVPARSWYSLPGEQFTAVAFSIPKASILNGTFSSTEGITVYLMTPAQLLYLAKEGTVDTFVWTSGWQANLTVTNLAIDVQPGQWDVVFFNPVAPNEWNPTLTTTILGFYTDLTLRPA